MAICLGLLSPHEFKHLFLDSLSFSVSIYESTAIVKCLLASSKFKLRTKAQTSVREREREWD